jgi:hypothetical protein
MAAAEDVLLRRARRAYEVGRALLGVRRAFAVLPMAALSLWLCGRPSATCALAGLLAALVIALEWRGQDYGRGARLGLLAGLPALLLPLGAEITGQACGTSLCALYPTLCAVGGVLGGSWLVRRGVRAGVSAHGLVAASTVAIVAGSLGCLIAGVAGVGGLLVGLVAGAAPTLVWHRA